MTDKERTPLTARRGYPILYMFVVTFVSTGLLVAFSRATTDRIEANRQVFFERAVLQALGYDEMSTRDVHRTFVDHVSGPTPGSAGAYVGAGPGGSMNVFALPFEGQGFWNRIRGVVGISHDGTRLTGIAFYEQSETPGLGAEIVKPYFTGQFADLELGDTPVLRLQTAGVELGPGDVHAITGATQTCTRLEKILNDAIADWRSEMEMTEETP